MFWYEQSWQGGISGESSMGLFLGDTIPNECYINKFGSKIWNATREYNWKTIQGKKQRFFGGQKLDRSA